MRDVARVAANAGVAFAFAVVGGAVAGSTCGTSGQRRHRSISSSSSTVTLCGAETFFDSPLGPAAIARGAFKTELLDTKATARRYITRSQAQKVTVVPQTGHFVSKSKPYTLHRAGSENRNPLWR